MAKPILLLIKSNPLKTHRPVEAVRIALGLASGEHSVQIVLMNHAPLLLGAEAEDLVDGDILMKYLPTFKEWEQTFFVEENAWKAAELGESDFKVAPISMAQIVQMMRGAGRFMIY